MRREKQTKKRAFTLMELLIVIIILGLLAALIMPSLTGKSEEAKAKLVCVQMKSIGEALKMFKMDQGTYPETAEGLKALLQNPDAEKYPNYPAKGYFEGKNLPKDPWNRDFIYTKAADEFEIVSIGADGKEGGEKDGKDISYTQCQQSPQAAK